jgi:hypothetical protein
MKLSLAARRATPMYWRTIPLSLLLLSLLFTFTPATHPAYAQTDEPEAPVETAEATDTVEATPEVTLETTEETPVESTPEVTADVTPEQTEAAPEGGLQAVDYEIVQRPDIFGSDGSFVDGVVENTSTTEAFTGIELYAELYDSADALIGEGFGYPVNACGTGLVTDFTLQPGGTQPFALQVELYEEGADIARVDVLPEAEAIPAAEINPFLSFPGVSRVTGGEVVNIEWIDPTHLRYAIGCDTDVFTNQNWFSYDLTSMQSASMEHPQVAALTDAMLQQTGLTTPELLNHSYLSFHPDNTRMVYQTDINTILTAERDGSFKRLLYDDLARVSLHGFIWLPEGRFLAYYYGAYGDEVRYFTASLAGQLISATVYDVQPSQTIPGPFSDGGRVITGATIGEQTGYFVTSTQNAASELLFEYENLPGNNYPAPLYVPGENGEERIYFVLPDTTPGQAQLQCFQRPSNTLTPLTRLPLNLTTDDRAWTWLSPDQQTLALAANGASGGLWLINLGDLPACGAADQTTTDTITGTAEPSAGATPTS